MRACTHDIYHLSPAFYMSASTGPQNQAVAEKMHPEKQRLGRSIRKGALAMKVQAGCPKRQEGAGIVDCHLTPKTVPGPDQGPP